MYNPQQFCSPAQAEAFRFLQAVVEDLWTTGKRRLGAFLKPELIRRSGGAFNAGVLGYEKFADFLRAAEAAGYIKLESCGLDLEACPLNASPAPAPKATWSSVSTHHGAEQIEIRRDLWDVFVDYTPGLLRIYDRGTDRAYKIPELAYPGEPADVTALRSRLLRHEDGLEAVRPIQPVQLIDWMRGFASRRTGSVSQTLLAALQTEHPIGDFTRAVRSDPSLDKEWKLERLEKVAGYISAWLTEHGIRTQVKVPRTPRYGSSVQATAASARAVLDHSSQQLAEITRMVEVIDAAVDGLLRLRGTLSYLGRRSGKQT